MNTPPRLIVSTILLAGVFACDIKIAPADSDSGAPSSSSGGSGDSGDSTATEGDSQGATSTSAGHGATSTAGAPTSTPTTDPYDPSETTGNATTDNVTTSETGTTSAGTTEDVSTTLYPGTNGSVTMLTDGEEPRPCDSEVPIDAEILSYLESQIPEAAGTTGEDDDPNLIYIRFSDLPFTCADPHDRVNCGHHWDLSVRIPSAFQAPGLYAFSWEGPHAFGYESGPDVGQGDDCDGGGSVAKGTLEILAIDDDKITGRLCGVTWNGLDNSFALEGTFVAPRCQ